VRSLRTTDAVKGEKVASALQSLADGVQNTEGLLLKRLVEDVFLAAGVPVPQIILEPLPVLRLVFPFGEGYLERRKGKVSGSRFNVLQSCLRDFARKHKGMELPAFQGAHIQAWLDGLREGGSADGTVCNRYRALSAMFDYARAMGAVSVNPCEAVDAWSPDGAVERLPMEDADLEKLLCLLRASGRTEWEAVVMFARYAGLRLQDATRIGGRDVTFQGDACLLQYWAGKTDKAEVVPCFEPLAGFLKQRAGCTAFSAGLAGMGVATLSKHFAKLCDDAGVDPQPVTLRNGRVHRRVCFHSLRHSFCTWLARKGVPEALRMKLSAHATERAHRGYDHTSALDVHRQVASYFLSQQNEGSLS
jgi:integrase